MSDLITNNDQMWTHLHTCYFCVSILHEADWGDHPSIDVIELSARDERISVLGCPWVTNTEYWAAYSRSPKGWAPCTFTEKQHFQPFARQIITLKLILYSWLFCSVYIQVIPPKSFLLSRVKQWSAEHWPKYCSGFCWVSRASKQLVGTNSCATSARRHFLDNFFISRIEKSYLK